MRRGLGLLVMAFAPALALSHAFLVKSDPLARAVLARAPAEARLWFNERLEPAFVEIELRRGARKIATPGKAAVSGGDPKLLVLALPALEPGEYALRYRVLSVDGHVASGAFNFTVKEKNVPRGR